MQIFGAQIMGKFPITIRGYEKLEEEIKLLKHIERPKIAYQIKIAKEHGDLSENAEYDAARQQQSFNEGKIQDLEDKKARAEIIDTSKLSGSTIKFGATVELIDDETDEKVTYIIVGEYEADINKKRVSVASPIAKALIGKTAGDIVEVLAPRANKSYEVLSVQYKKLDI